MKMTLEETINLCRRLGVLQFKSPDFEFVLGPPELAQVPETAAESRPVVSSIERRGEDGLTKSQQDELYMRPMGDTE